MDIPEYYRKYQSPGERPEQKPVASPVISAPPHLYQADRFSLKLYDDWQDDTVYTIVGPVTSGIQHNIIITVEPDIQFETVTDYAQMQIRTLEEGLKSCRLLKQDNKKLNNGIQAYEAVFSWYPTDDLRIYQQQLFVLVDKTGYKLTASFTKKTRKTIGPAVERMMLSFNPVSSAAKIQPSR